MFVYRDGQDWILIGIADSATGYGKKREIRGLHNIYSGGSQKKRKPRSQLTANLAAIRQLRIGARKLGATVQGSYSDGDMYKFVCLRDDGTVISFGNVQPTPQKPDLRPSSILGLTLITTAALSSPYTSLL